MIEGKSAKVIPISGFGKFMIRMIKNRSRIINGIKPDILIEDEKDYETGISLLKNRHSYLSEFLGSDYTVLFRLNVKIFIYVNHFQEVFKWKP